MKTRRSLIKKNSGTPYWNLVLSLLMFVHVKKKRITSFYVIFLFPLLPKNSLSLGVKGLMIRTLIDTT